MRVIKMEELISLGFNSFNDLVSVLLKKKGNGFCSTCKQMGVLFLSLGHLIYLVWACFIIICWGVSGQN